MRIVPNILFILYMLESLIAENNFLENYIDLTTAPPENFGARLKCGEGPQRGKFICVPYYNCHPSTNTTIDYPEVDGSHHLNQRFGRVSDPLCANLLEVCCKIENPNEIAYYFPPKTDTKLELRCGVDKPEKLNKYAWIATITNNSQETLCTGFIISAVAVLTTANCVNNLKPEEIQLELGKWNNKIMIWKKSVSKIIVHEHYFAKPLYNNVAILILKTPFIENDNIKTICIPKNWDDISKEKFLVLGSNENFFANKIKIYKSSLISNAECQQILRQEFGKEFILHRSFICSQQKIERNNCKSEKSIGLISQNSMLVGITSFGKTCNQLVPIIHTSILLYRDWIDYKLIELGYNTKSYTFP